MADLIGTSQRRISEGCRVRLHFSILLESGEEVDTTRRGKAAVFCFGDGNLLPGFEQALIGMCAGDDAQLLLQPEDAFGERHPDNVQLIPAAQFADMSVEPGLLVSFTGPGGELPGTVRRLEGSEVEVDFNHPLAGRRIVFDVSILQVLDA